MVQIFLLSIYDMIPILFRKLNLCNFTEKTINLYYKWQLIINFYIINIKSLIKLHPPVVGFILSIERKYAKMMMEI